MKRNLARKLAREAAIRGLKLAAAGKLKEAKDAELEAKLLEQEWRRLGGKGPLT